MSLFQRQYLNILLKEENAIDKCTLNNNEFDNELCKFIFEKIKQKENINTTTLADIYDENKQDFSYMNVNKYDTLKKHIFELEKEFEQSDLELVIKKKHRDFITEKHYENSLQKLKDGENIDTIISNSDNFFRFIDKEECGYEIRNAKSFIEMYKARTKEMEDARNSGEVTHYSFFHPLLKKYTRMKLGHNVSLIGGSASGKTLNAVQMALNFVIDYSKRILFVTDENDEETIHTYFQCCYFGLKFRDVDDRTVDLAEHIKSLSKKERDEYEYIMSFIDIVEMQGIPTEELENKLKRAENSGNKYFLTILDSFDEINTTGNNYDEVTRYDKNAKLVEVLAKNREIILMVTCQLKSDYYNVSIEKMPILATHQSKTIVKKNFFSILLHNIYDKDGNNLSFAVKINKSRTGGTGVIYLANKNYDYIDLEVEGNELDVPSYIKQNKKKDIEDDNFDF